MPNSLPCSPPSSSLKASSEMDLLGFAPVNHSTPLYAPDYSDFLLGCDWCGRMLSQVADSVPLPCFRCNCTHYCNLLCLRAHFQTSHTPSCLSNMDANLDLVGSQVYDKANALFDLKMYGSRWHDALGDAAISALNLSANPGVMDEKALVVHVSFVQWQPYRMRRFQFSHATVETISSLSGPMLNAAIVKRQQNALVNQQNGMMGCILIVLVCKVPEVGFIFNSTFVGPEESVLAYPPIIDWERWLGYTLQGNKAS